MIEKEIVLEVKNLKKYFPAGRRHMLKAVDDVSFTIHKGETFGIVGESGCGKQRAHHSHPAYPGQGAELLRGGSDPRFGHCRGSR